MEILPPMDAAAAAVFLGVSVPTIRVWTRTGVIGHLRFGGTVRYTIEQLLNPIKVERSQPARGTVGERLNGAIRAA